MAAKKRGLGRGLDALLGGSSSTVVSEEVSTDKPANGSFTELPVGALQRGRYQPRTDMAQEALEELADSIRVQGIIQPIVVRPLAAKDSYEIIAGERRWRAAQLAGLERVPTIIHDIPDESAIAVALIENIQRENLNPIEEAVALRRLIDEFEMTHQQASEAVGRSRASVSNLLRLLDLNSDVRELVEKGLLEMGHARALLAVTGQEQSRLASEVVARDLNVRETEKLVKKGPVKKKAASKSKTLDPDIRRLQDSLSEKLGASVKFEHSDKGSGRVVIGYNSLDELDGILEHIK